jgi:hypothetical protein
MTSIIVLMLFLFITIGVSGLISLPARIPYLRRRAQNSKLFRIALILLFSGITIVTFAVIFAFLTADLNVGLVGPCAIYDNVSEDLDFEFSCEKTNSLKTEVFLRYLLLIFKHPVCFSSDAEICTAANAFSTQSSLAFWVIGLFFGVITGTFTARHTRDSRKQKVHS